MAMVAGTVTISITGVASGDGYAREMYNKLEADTDFQGLVGLQLQTAKQPLADVSNIAGSMITHLQTNSTVTTVDDGSAGAIPWAGTGSGGVVL